jgi:hypothetical protein
MKMMSWSRYHCLSGSLLRNPRRFSRRYRKTPQRSHVPQPHLPADGPRASLFRFVLRLFRT